jgi:exodeoxyribonuclease VII large subunit
MPGRIALLTSVPSSALADMLRTARERWPATGILMVPIPVQGAVEEQICRALERVGASGLSAWGWRRSCWPEVEAAARISACLMAKPWPAASRSLPVPVVCGIGHEDDTTIADLVADHRAATPTAALVALLPDSASRCSWPSSNCGGTWPSWWRCACRASGSGWHSGGNACCILHPSDQLRRRRSDLEQARRLLQALSPQHLLERGFSLVRHPDGSLVRRLADLEIGMRIGIDLVDGHADAVVGELRAQARRGAD